MKTITAILALCWVTTLNAANRIAASASYDDVQAAVNAAADGDVILIPNGSATWTNGIKTNKQIIIRDRKSVV